MVTQQISQPAEYKVVSLPRPRFAVVPAPAKREITADTIARIAAWAMAHDTTFADLVYEWTPRGGLRALARHIERHDPISSGPETLPRGA